MKYYSLAYKEHVRNVVAINTDLILILSELRGEGDYTSIRQTALICKETQSFINVLSPQHLIL
jgi:hypothetical protein